MTRENLCRLMLGLCLIAGTQAAFGQNSKTPQPAATLEKQLLGKWELLTVDGGFLQFFPGNKLVLGFGQPNMLVEYQIEKFGNAYKMNLRLPKFLEPLVPKEKLEYNQGEVFYIDILDETSMFLIIAPSEAEDWKAQLPSGILLKKTK